ncbi:MAG: type IX secretion system outer membrane channel protein PorV [Bacteroidales bacterium]|nr:type IX secretion system outer membrane channel protein PorV [Bacteroidales bacterium]
MKTANNLLKFKILIATILASTITSQAQITPNQDPIGRKDKSNIISTAASFLLIAPDSRSGALGDAGVATSPDINSQHWNASKYVFAEEKTGISLSYTPWLKNYVDDMSISYLAGFNKFKRNQALGYSLTYFSLGDMTFTDIEGATLKQFNPKEFAIDISYSLKMAENLSGGLTMRYIYSNLTGGITVNNSEETHAGHSVAGDLSIYYKKEFETGNKTHTLSLGANISNIGTKISYTSNNSNFIPTNMKLGAGYKIDMDQYNSLLFTFDLNKLLVPTPPIYDETNDNIIAGKDDDVSVPVGIFQSFGDAPDGFSEELKEISYSMGLEYWYSKTFAGRMGYFTESKEKGGRKYLTFGVGLKLNVFSFDFSYLVTTTSSNPLQNTVRFTLGLNFDKFKK